MNSMNNGYRLFSARQLLQKSTSIFQRQAHNKSLKEILAEKIPIHLERINQIKKQYGSKEMGKIQLNQIYAGMRGMLGLIYETSLVDPNDGLNIRGCSIPELQKSLPKADGGEQPLPEGVFWLMLTGDIPTKEQVKQVSEEWAYRSDLPSYVVNLLKATPPNLHPMTQFSTIITALSHESRFRQAYECKVHKNKLWESAYEDAMDLIARVTKIAALIYRMSFKNDKSGKAEVDLEKDWSANYCHMLGFDKPQFTELMRLYLVLHCDHEGGNASAHTVRVVGSTLTDPYLSFAAGMNALAGPLHGLANQEVLQWIQQLMKEISQNPTEDQIKEYVQKTLKSGNVVPGYGHAVLRKTDPRYTCQREFAQKHLPDDPLVKIVSNLFKVVPPILEATGKIKSPWPNVDAHSGALLYHYGLVETSYYTVLFGVSRSLGALASLVWDRALRFPIERPKSITTDDVEKLICSGGQKKEIKQK